MRGYGWFVERAGRTANEKVTRILSHAQYEKHLAFHAIYVFRINMYYEFANLRSARSIK